VDHGPALVRLDRALHYFLLEIAQPEGVGHLGGQPHVIAPFHDSVLLPLDFSFSGFAL
jgi:hypothetical protein